MGRGAWDIVPAAASAFPPHSALTRATGLEIGAAGRRGVPPPLVPEIPGTPVRRFVPCGFTLRWTPEGSDCDLLT
ncbi:MAG: hypothetical protein KME26_26035 [Oscillatoria princeps RMCB-10]|nr:hypothetical protein [Oscillatoria princeps RMCB-10]